jgi:hypothetical protein
MQTVDITPARAGWSVDVRAIEKNFKVARFYVLLYAGVYLQFSDGVRDK